MHCQHHIQWAKPTSIPLKIGKKTGMSAFTSLFQHILEVLAIAIRHEEEIKGIQIGNEEIILLLFADDMMTYSIQRTPTIPSRNY